MTITLQTAADMFATARNREAGKPLANNTRLRRVESGYAVRLHDTDVVTLHDDGRVTLDTGGWFTVTTKERMNRYAPVRVFSERGVWYVSHDANRGPYYPTPAESVPYFDGITFDAKGKCLNGPTPAQWAAYKAERAAVDKAVATYVKGFVKALEKGMPMPSGGDCWFCSMFEGQGHSDHLHSHMEEKYYVPSLAILALRESGYKDEGIYFFLGMHPEAGTMGGDRRIVADVIRRALAKYLRKNLHPTLPRGA